MEKSKVVSLNGRGPHDVIKYLLDNQHDIKDIICVVNMGEDTVINASAIPNRTFSDMVHTLNAMHMLSTIENLE